MAILTEEQAEALKEAARVRDSVALASESVSAKARIAEYERRVRSEAAKKAAKTRKENSRISGASDG